MKFLSTYFDLPGLGCGVRNAAVVAERKAGVRLFFPATCTAVTVPAKAIDKAKDITPKDKREARHMARVIRDTYQSRKRLHLSVANRETKAVMADLKAMVQQKEAA